MLDILAKAALGAIVLTIAGCTTDIPDRLSTFPPGGEATFTAVMVATEVETPSPGGIPSSTPTPPDTYTLESRPWPETGDLVLPLDNEVVFFTSAWDLPPGNYFVAKGADEGSVVFVSTDLSETGPLLRLPNGIRHPDGVVSGGDRVLLFERGRTSRFYDVTLEQAWSLGETCIYDQVQVSPGGSWIAALCDPARTRMGPDSHVVLEILSTQGGTGQQLAVPVSPRTNRNEGPHITWVSDDLLAIERFWTGEELGLCVLPPSRQTLYCPPGLPKDSPGILSHIDLSAHFLPLTDLHQLPWRGWLVPAGCLAPGQECSNLIDLGELAWGNRAMVLWGSPDPGLVWWITALDPTPITRAGMYEAPEWQPRELIELGGSYSIEGMCPDGHCVILVNLDNEMRYRLDLDGTLTPFPHGEIIGSFAVP